MLKECKPNECQNEWQQLHWNEQGHEKDRIKDGGMWMKRI